MRKKVIDIYPPSEKEGEEKKSYSAKAVEEDTKKKWIIPVVLLFVVLTGYFYYTSYRAEITIYPKTEEFRGEEKVLVRSFGALGEGELRGLVLSKRISDNREFPIEERRLVEEKTTGRINVCQNYRDSSVHFREGTRFVSDEGKTFLAKDSFNLPSKQENDGCNMVGVIAGGAGEDYNIPSDSKFALPGLEGTNIYGSVKGVSFTLEKEGVSKEVPYLDDDTMARAEEEMKRDLFERGIELIKDEYGEEYRLESEAQYVIEVAEREFTEEETEEEAEKFHFKLDVNVRAIAVQKENIDRFIETLLPENHTWRRETEEMNIDFTRINFEDGDADILISFAAEIYEKVNKEEWRRELAGLDFDEAERLLEEKIPEGSVSIRTRPFGLDKIPGALNRVKVLLEFDPVE